MKKIIVTITMLLAFLIPDAWGQNYSLGQQNAPDYSRFVYADKYHTFQLLGVAQDESVTVLYVHVSVNHNKAGWFSISSKNYLTGDFDAQPIGLLQIGEQDYAFDTAYNYPRGNKGNGVTCAFVFRRIPAGVNYITLTGNGAFTWSNIPVTDNPNTTEQTKFTDSFLRQYWRSSETSPIEGIYTFSETNDKNWWGDVRHTLAVVRDGYEYKLIYLKGSNPKVWKEGEVKAVFSATATPGLYKASKWYMDNKMENPDFYFVFDEGTMRIAENNNNVSATFIKLFPTFEDKYSNGQTSSSSQTVDSDSPYSTGSGIFVSSKVIATNYHVVEGANKIEVQFKDGTSVKSYKAKVLSTDKTNDLSLLMIDDSRFYGVGTLPYAIVSRTKDVGTSVFTMGYPYASFMGEEVKVTDGIISSKTGFDGDIVTYQISAPIQPGNSGGPLFDKKGNLIGITNAGITAAQNVGYAIKSSYLCNLIDSAPVSIDINETNSVANLDLVEQIKILSKYVVYIKIY